LTLFEVIIWHSKRGVVHQKRGKKKGRGISECLLRFHPFPEDRDKGPGRAKRGDRGEKKGRKKRGKERLIKNQLKEKGENLGRDTNSKGIPR